ncbi:permease prefix domain 1-containing protein [Myceligenerans pegani]|uniref:DUF1707 domain-containing protein n=1 Tax=Myceligenerans pegani TaxID=2776917 RepID=A0ABR9N4A8_9MICO|nr:permease prefix domain 1-containing protein [Myceligenerans sp. TRM 65318]MBE1878506.1 hypothetical protein [Myceligenerans sp. TRM 65318]MBE3020777.1 hypothetical protein [Myceligenerans sp. TRM 65318]
MSGENVAIHRLLDEAFAGIAMSPDVQDLKEEIRSNLVDRVAELEAGGTSSADAARHAVDELGDVGAIVRGEFPDAVPEASVVLGDERAPDRLVTGTHPSGGPDSGVRRSDDPGGTHASGVPGSGTHPSGGFGSGAPAGRPGGDGHHPRSEPASSLAARHRVRPRPGYVAVTVLMSIVLAGALVGTVLAAIGAARADAEGWLPAVFAVVAAGALGWLVGASLAQETTTNYPMPAGRAALFGLGWALVLLGALLAIAHLFVAAPYAWYALDGLALVAGVVLLAYLAATSTNRTKPWALEQGRRHAEAGSRFDEDPATAARFGIYTVALWALTGGAILVVGFTFGWVWVPIPALLGFAVFMLMLARMNFGPARK